jgi:ElaB/YqjD/DUF883 family membrane-anchored ribosome-binding protein
LSETIDALQTRLEPSRVAAQVKEKVRERATEAIDNAKATVKTATREKAEHMVSQMKETVSNTSQRAGDAFRTNGARVVDYIRANPVPVTLIGTGLGALAMYGYFTSPQSRWGSSEYSMDDQDDDDWNYQNRDFGDEDEAYTARSRMNDYDVRMAGESFVQRARETGRRSASMVKDNGMATGLVALAAGVLIGMTLPVTDTERHYLGDARERLMHRTKDWLRQAGDRMHRHEHEYE